jgi:hypothetical protein
MDIGNIFAMVTTWVGVGSYKAGLVAILSPKNVRYELRDSDLV